MNKYINVTPVADRIYILSGCASVGKLHLARTIKNAVIVDDLYLRKKNLSLIVEQATMLHMNGMHNPIAMGLGHEYVYSKDMVLIFITSEDFCVDYIKKMVISVVEGYGKHEGE